MVILDSINHLNFHRKNIIIKIEIQKYRAIYFQNLTINSFPSNTINLNRKIEMKENKLTLNELFCRRYIGIKHTSMETKTKHAHIHNIC